MNSVNVASRFVNITMNVAVAIIFAEVWTPPKGDAEALLDTMTWVQTRIETQVQVKMEEQGNTSMLCPIQKMKMNKRALQLLSVEGLWQI